jgi:trehalose synthase-fused probable maltokinase
MTDAEISLGSGGVIDDEALLPFLTRQRWYGAHARDAQATSIVDTVPLTADGALRLLLVELTFESGTHDLYQLLVRERDGELSEATGDPLLSSRVVELLANGEVVDGGGGRLAFTAIRPIEPPAAPTGELLGGEATNSVVVVGDLLLKTYRRVQAGTNPELDMLLFFAEHGFAHAPELVGWYGYEGERVQATLGLFQRYVPDATDGWALGLHELATTPETFLARLHRIGAVIGEMHGVLAADGSDPGFAPEEPTPESAGLVTARIDEEIDRTFDELGDREELGALVGRRSDAHDLLVVVSPSATAGRSIRTHGDLHLGQVLRHDDDWMVIDFEGEPARAATARRQKTSALRDVAGMLRSISYLVAAARREGTVVDDGWEREAREQLLDAYRGSSAAVVLPSTVEAQDQQLVMFELEKAFYELRYELDHRPDWVEIPVAGIVAMLERTT